MKYVWLSILAVALFAQEPEINVNARYRVESVEIAGADESAISSDLRDDIKKLIGEHLSQSSLDDLARRIRNELHVRVVSPKVSRGASPEQVKVVFEVVPRRAKFDVSLPKFLYHAKQGWSATLESSVTVDTNKFSFAVLSDGDELFERFAGVAARYENRKIGTDRVRLGFQFESFHEQWNRATLAALDRWTAVPGTYRTRQNFQPTTTFVLTKPLTLTVGVSFERFQTQFPAARTEASNAVISTLRYHRPLEDSDANKHDLDAGYSLRAATRIFSSDFVYARHRLDFRYAFSRDRHTVITGVMAGAIVGRAPLYERYVLGTSSTLRGWNKFDVDPLGGDRMEHNSLEYRYLVSRKGNLVLQIFYDSGAVWSQDKEAIMRHSVGLGLRQGVLWLALAFPIKDGRAEPVLMMGMNY